MFFELTVSSGYNYMSPKFLKLEGITHIAFCRDNENSTFYYSVHFYNGYSVSLSPEDSIRFKRDVIDKRLIPSCLN